MNKNNFQHASLIIVILLLFIMWDFFKLYDTSLHIIGLSVIPLISGLVSFTWTYKAYQRVTVLKGYFSTLMIAILFTTLGSSLWILAFSGYLAELFLSVSQVLWITSYVLLLIALIVRFKIAGLDFKNIKYMFNLTIYMVFSFSVSYHFIVEPFISLPTINAFNKWFIVGYQLADLSLIFFGLIMYYLVITKKIEKTAIFLVMSLFMFVLADALLVMQYPDLSYSSGGMNDLLWMMGPFFVGLTGLLHNDKLTPEKQKDYFFLTEKNELYIPYAIIITLVLLELHSYGWQFNILSLAVLTVILLVLGKQFIVMRENDDLFKEMEFLALHDALTGLKNRYSLIRDLSEAVQRKNEKLSLLLIDLDRFKNINDTLGHHVGDQVLATFASRMQLILEKEVELYRLGGDEFVLVIEDGTVEKSTLWAEAILDVFLEGIPVANSNINLTPSIGISLFPKDAYKPEDLMKYADVAMYQAKKNGKNNYSFFDSVYITSMVRKIEVENDIKVALNEKQFYLVYQPKLDLCTGKISGLEALIRWNHPKLGMISPMEFIPIAEETGQIIDIGNWVLEEACHQLNEWHLLGFNTLHVSVNVSVLQLEDENFIRTIEQVLKRSGVESRFLEIEITETIMQNTTETIELLKKLSNVGVHSSLDDFGTGYSSLHVLEDLPINSLKIDQSFIRKINETSLSPIADTIIDLGIHLGLSIVAEGIETKEQLSYLIAKGCHFGQGYYISKPLNREHVLDFLRDYTSQQELPLKTQS